MQLTLDRYSHWMPYIGRNTAEGIDEALSWATTLTLGFLLWLVRTQPQGDVGWLHRLPYHPN